MNTQPVETERTEPLLRQPVPDRELVGVRWIGAVRIPLAGAYRPWAHLYVGPDGGRWWTVRLWAVDRAVLHVVPTDRLRAYARASRLPRLLRAIEALSERADAGGGP